ncbi:MAG TPA: zinc-dependent metalloprotease [Candidatus Binatia bacterium]|nr:zinc-dependent metalloprotease [Candidatus Binatia bacterium]
MSDASRSGGKGRLNDPLWQGGFLVGAAIGAAATVIGRRAERSARRGLVDWPSAERIAIARLRRAPGTLSPAELAASQDAYTAAMALIAPRLAAALETELPGVVERAVAVDRAGWVRANVATFAQLIGHLEGRLLDQVMPPGSGLAQASMAIANRYVTTRQLGFLLGFMGQRVLGQYDLALLSAEATPGRLLFVEENIRQTARSLDVPLDAFRTWIALHETTHAFEFESHPWLRPYLAERLERQLGAFSEDLAGVSRDTVRQLGRVLRGERAGDHWLERLMTQEQRRLFRETQAVMSLLEGFSDYVMDEVGRDIVPDVERISARFHARREQKSGFERAVSRLIGMDLKLDQYKKGERFVRAVAEQGGPAALRRLWDGPETLPRDGEIDAPETWLARVLGTSPAGAGT